MSHYSDSPISWVMKTNRIRGQIDRCIALAPNMKQIKLFPKDFDLLLSTIPEHKREQYKNVLTYRGYELVRYTTGRK